MAKVEIRQASIADQEGVVALLENFYPGIPDHWRKLFKPRSWTTVNDFPGFVIADSDKIVGFLGTIFSEYETQRGKARFCNMTTWYIDPHYRQYSMPLLMKVLKLTDVTLTNLSLSPHVYDCLTKLGFKTLENKQVLILPLPKILYKNTEINVQVNINEHHLKHPLKEIYRAHKTLNCKHILITEGNDQCYCLVVITKYKKISLGNIYFVSNSELFRRVLSRIRFMLCRKLRVFYLMVEGRILGETKISGMIAKEKYPPRLYKSATLTAEDISLLYSELFLLNI